MAVPKKRGTKAKQNKRRMNFFLKRPNFVVCPKCGNKVLSHTVCLNCGYYKGMQVIDVLKKLNKKEKKLKEKEMRGKEAEAKATGKEKPLSWEELSKK